MNKYVAPALTLAASVATLCYSVYTLYFTKLPLIVPCTSGVAFFLFTRVVLERDWPQTWKPLLGHKRSV
jgi:hypothetical protein